MILADTSVWVDHLRSGDARLINLLESGGVLIHPFIIGEISLGNLGQRDVVLQALRALPSAAIATEAELSIVIEQQRLFGLGIRYVDAHLLAATQLTPDASLWTRDRRLLEAATRMGLAGA